MTAMHRIATAGLTILLGSAGAAQQTPPAITTPSANPGELIVEPPTLINLGFEWLIDGDANRNAKVDVSYRKAGSGSSNFYIADSTFLGRNDSKHLIGWNGAFWEQFHGVEGQEFPPVMKSYTAIRLYGPGHVVAHNYVADFHDGIDTEMYGMPDGSHAHDGPAYPPRDSWDRRPVALDIYNNYITNAHDNSIEMDGSMHNIRLMRNVLINSASHPMSTQPSVGGPIYAAIDRGVALANINDGFAGQAPDLGALEAGQPVPIYGPRD